VHAMPRQPRNGKIFMLTALMWAALVTGVLIAAASRNMLPSAPDAWTYDWRTALLSPRAEQPRDDIAIVLIGERTLALYPYVSPLDRRLVGTVVEAIDTAGARAIGLDMFFERETEEAKTAFLHRAIAEANAPVVLGAVNESIDGITERQLAYQSRFLDRSAASTGHVLIRYNPEGLTLGDRVIREIPTPMEGDPPLPTFAETVAREAGWSGDVPSGYIAWQRPPARSGASLFTVFTLPEHEPGSPASEILPESWRTALEDKIVLVGADMFDRDQQRTPFSVLGGQRTPGVFVHAQIIAQMLDGREVEETPRLSEAVMVFALVMLGFWLSWRWRIKRYDFALSVIGIAALIGIGAYAFWAYALVVPSASLFAGWLAGIWGGHYAPRVVRRAGARVTQEENDRETLSR